MNKYLRLTFIFIGIWIVISLMCMLAGGTLVFMFEFKNIDRFIICICLFFSFLFPIPFVFLVWLVAIISMTINNDSLQLYKIILNTSFFISIGMAILFYKEMSYEFGNESKVFSLSICAIVIINTISSILIFRKKIKATK